MRVIIITQVLHCPFCNGIDKDEVLLQLKKLLEPNGISRYYKDGWRAYERHIEAEKHAAGKQHTQRIESKHINLLAPD